MTEFKKNYKFRSIKLHNFSINKQRERGEKLRIIENN